MRKRVNSSKMKVSNPEVSIYQNQRIDVDEL
nr:MAG TPA: hypothetical protein [Bacteriophage sp.]